jgi:hypothetical protein
MSSILPIPSIISLSKICEYLAKYDSIIDNGLNNGSLNSNLSKEIYQARKNVEYMYNENPTDINLVLMGDYLYALCSGLMSKAKTIFGSNGGVIIPPNSSTNVYAFAQLRIVVDGNSGSPIVNTSTYQNNELIGATELYQITIAQQIMYVGTGYTFNSVTGTLTFVNYIWNTDDVAVLTFNKKIN